MVFAYYWHGYSKLIIMRVGGWAKFVDEYNSGNVKKNKHYTFIFHHQ